MKNTTSRQNFSDSPPMQAKPDPSALEEATRILKTYNLSEEEEEVFLQSEKRVSRLLGIEKYKNRRIVVEVEDSTACLAGHGVGDHIYFNPEGFLLIDYLKKPVCARLLNKIWYRLVMIMDRIADGSADYIGDGSFKGDILEVRMTCYGADFPYGDCGQVLMKVTVE